MRILFAFVLVAASLTACKKTETDSAALKPTPTAPAGSQPAVTPPSSGGDLACLVGAWLSKVGDKNLYTFNADKTGERVHVDKDHSTFTWSMKDATTALVVFPAHDSTLRAEFEFKVDCAASPTEIKFQGMVPFLKQP